MSIDSTSEQALYFDIKSSESLNSIMIVEQSRIFIGNVTHQVSVEQAVQLLENCSYDTPIKPNAENFNELIQLLKANL